MAMLLLMMVMVMMRFVAVVVMMMTGCIMIAIIIVNDVYYTSRLDLPCPKPEKLKLLRPKSQTMKPLALKALSPHLFHYYYSVS